MHQPTGDMARVTKASQKLGKKGKPWKKASFYKSLPKILASSYHCPSVSVMQQIHQHRKASGSGMVLDKVVHSYKNLCFQTAAILTLKEACQAYLLDLYEDWNLCAMHAKRVGVLSSDLHLVRCLRSEMMR